MRHGSPLAAVDLWSLAVDEIPLRIRDDPASGSVLSPDELVRHAAFHFRRHRDLFLSTRLLIRGVLSHYAAVPPGGWRFRASALGQPTLEPTQAHRHGLGSLRFSLSRSTALSLCAVSFTGTPGVDLEDLLRDPGVLELVPAVLSAAEAADHARAPQSVPAFLRYWTLKEAYVKARGLGLNLPVQDARFRFTPSGTVSAEFAPTLEDSPVRWRFRSFILRGRYAAALAFHPDA